jgi:hypothetical protein
VSNLAIRSAAELLIGDACLPLLQWYARLILGLCRLGFWRGSLYDNHPDVYPHFPKIYIFLFFETMA